MLSSDIAFLYKLQRFRFSYFTLYGYQNSAEDKVRTSMKLHRAKIPVQVFNDYQWEKTPLE